MGMKHTPGPWSEFGPLKFTVYGGDPVRRIAVVDYTQGTSSEESAANARLIAAAPELLAALEAIAGVLEAPRDRLGRLDIAATQGDAREALRLLAVKWNATGGTDYMHQCANVARAAIAKAKAKGEV